MTSKKKKSRHFFSPSAIHLFIHSLSQFPIENWPLNTTIRQNKTKKNHGYHHPQIYKHCHDDTYHYNREKKIQHIKNQKKKKRKIK